MNHKTTSTMANKMGGNTKESTDQDIRWQSYHQQTANAMVIEEIELERGTAPVSNKPCLNSYANNLLNHPTVKLKPTSFLTIQTQKLQTPTIDDNGASDHYSKVHTKVHNKQVAKPPLSVTLNEGTYIKSSHTE